VRVQNAYPLFDVGYRKHVESLHEYLQRFCNLHIAGRCGMFRYYNMDVAIRSGVETAEKVIKKTRAVDAAKLGQVVLMST
jgi:protoporphyrinogen oxidase